MELVIRAAAERRLGLGKSVFTAFSKFGNLLFATEAGSLPTSMGGEARCLNRLS